MPFNGTGTFTRLYNWVTDALNSIPITASRFDDEDDDFAEGLSTCITKDGQTIISANIPMNTHKFTGLTNGSARTDSIALGQVQDGTYTALGTTGGSADAYTASPAPAIAAYVATMQYSAKINATNLTTTPYLQISGIANPSTTAVIKKWDIAGAEIAVEISDLLSGKIYHFDRNPANDGWIVRNPEKAYIDATNITKGTMSIKGVTLLPKQIFISNNVSDPNNDIDFAVGIFQFSDGSGQSSSTALTKRLDATWVAGTNQGGLDTGSKANNTWYYCYGIYNPTSNVADFIFSTNVSTPSLPSGYTKYAKIGIIRTNGSGNIRAFSQNVNIITFKALVADRVIATLPTSPTNVTLTCPPSCIAIIQVNVISTANNAFLFCPTYYTDKTASAIGNNYTYYSGTSTAQTFSLQMMIETDSGSQISIDGEAATQDTSIFTTGFILNF